MPFEKNNGPGIQFLRSLLGTAETVCIAWPYSGSHKRGKCSHMGRLRWAPQIMCELAHGEAPSPTHQASHDCGNSLCVNPNHIVWKTPSANASDRRRHGTHANNRNGPKGKLTQEQRAQVRALKGKQANHHTAEQFGISLCTVRYWQGGKDKWPSHNRTA